MNRKVWKESEEIDEFRKDKIHLCALPVGRKKEGIEDPYVYHYRALESFWSILESDSFWATNARFSNDHEEQSLGMEKVKEVLGKTEKTTPIFDDCYIVCFCDENDKLSQWRGYAPEGVSIGFDFNNVRPFYIKATDGERFMKVYNSCYKVQYIEKNTGIDEFAEIFDLNTVKDENMREIHESQAKGIIPYIKHKGFYEEAESRLVFSGRDVDLSAYIHYRDVKSIKVPYIVVKAGDAEKNKSSICVIRINMDSESANQLKEKLQKHFLDKKIKRVHIVCCTSENEKKTDDRFCYGCSLREAYIPGVNGKNPRCRYGSERSQGFRMEIRNEIYISDCKQQEKICDEIYTVLLKTKEEEKINIWCEGHLPIRNITVGNLHNKEVVAESIRHYCKQHYWLRSVKVKCSDNPYRSSLL